MRTLSLCTCRRHYPGAAAGRIPRSSHPAVTAFPGRGRRVGLHIDLFEACSAFTRVVACTLARSPIRDPLSEGFRHFVASMPAPVASGGSEAPGGACTHWKPPPCHGAPHCGHSLNPSRGVWRGGKLSFAPRPRVPEVCRADLGDATASRGVRRPPSATRGRISGSLDMLRRRRCNGPRGLPFPGNSDGCGRMVARPRA